MDTANFIIPLNVAACFDELFDHPQATCAHKTKITIANFILGQNEVCCIVHIYNIKKIV
jgi:hypothetical protein